MAPPSLPPSPPLSSSSPPLALHRPRLAPLQLDPTPTEHLHTLSYQPQHHYTPLEGEEGRARRCFSELGAAGGEKVDTERIEAWRATVVKTAPEDDPTHGTEDETVGGAPLPFVDSSSFSSSSARRRGESPPLLSSPPVDVGPHFDSQDEASLALAALHDPSLFHSPTPTFDDGDGGPSQVGEEGGDEQPSSPSALQGDVEGRGRQKGKEVTGGRTPSEARTVDSVEMTRKGSKGKPSVQIHAHVVSSPPLRASPPKLRNPPATPPLSKSSSLRSHHGRHGSSASEQLLRLQSTSPPNHRSSPNSPFSHHPRPDLKRRFSSALTMVGVKHGPNTSEHLDSSRHFHTGSASDSLNKYLSAGRRSSLPASSPSTPLSTHPRELPLPDESTQHRRSSPSHSHLDLRHLASSAAHSISEHFPLPHSFLPHSFHLHTAPSPSPRLDCPTPFSLPTTTLPSPSTKTGRISWRSVKALSVRFRPGASEAAASSLGVNHFVLGLADLEAGGTRSWDPRAGEESPAGGEGKAEREKEWPSVLTEMGTPPRVEVVYEGGGRRTCEVAGLSPEQIVSAVLDNP